MKKSVLFAVIILLAQTTSSLAQDETDMRPPESIKSMGFLAIPSRGGGMMSYWDSLDLDCEMCVPTSLAIRTAINS